MIPREQWQWFGNAAHLIVSNHCRFHLATQVGTYLVSTVGEYVPPPEIRAIVGEDARGFTEIGYQRLYETMVFRAGPPCAAPECACGLPIPQQFDELDFAGYQDAGAATRGHLEMCEKWAREPAAAVLVEPLA